MSCPTAYGTFCLMVLWGGPPGPRGTPSSRSRNNGVSIVQGASRPTGASAADQGVRPTIYTGTHHGERAIGVPRGQRIADTKRKPHRSEERRVGKGWRSRGSPY